MTNLEKNFTTWATALRSGDSRYLMITRVDDDWYLLTEHEVTPILALNIFIDGGAGLRPEYTYIIDDPDDDGLMSSMIVRDHAQMIVKDSNGLYAFGLPDEQAPADAILIYARAETQCLSILAHRSGCHMHTFEVDYTIPDSGLAM